MSNLRDEIMAVCDDGDLQVAIIETPDSNLTTKAYREIADAHSEGRIAILIIPPPTYGNNTSVTDEDEDSNDDSGETPW